MSPGSRAPRVIVVGGGAIGCACAAELAARGASVTLLERHELAAGASGRNHGLLLSPLDPALVPMAQASAENYEELAKNSPLPFRMDREPVGFLLVASDDDAERASGKEEAEAAAACGVPVLAVDAGEIHRLEPGLASDLVEGWLLEDARRLDPAALTVALALRGRRDGAEVRTATVVRSLITDGDAVRGVVTDEGMLEGDVVVVAAGPWTPSLLRTVGVRLPISGGRGWLVHLAPQRSVVSRLVSRAGWHVVPAGRRDRRARGPHGPPATGARCHSPGARSGRSHGPGRVVGDQADDPGRPSHRGSGSTRAGGGGRPRCARCNPRSRDRPPRGIHGPGRGPSVRPGSVQPGPVRMRVPTSDPYHGSVSGSPGAFSSVEDVQRALRGQSYLADRGLAVAIHLALSLDKPLLLEGEAGVGTTEVAKSLAAALDIGR